MVSLYLSIHVAVLCNKLLNLLDESLYTNNKLHKIAYFFKSHLDLRFTRRYCCRFKCLGMLYRVGLQMVTEG